MMLIRQSGGLAQLARAPALQAGGHRFDSDILHHPNERSSFKDKSPVEDHAARTNGVRSKTMALWRIAQRSDAEEESKKQFFK